MQCIYRCIWDFSCIQSGDSVHPANKHSSMTMTHLSWILCVSGSEGGREVKGLSDGNVLLRTGQGAGAGMEAALQPGKWLFSCASSSCIQQIHTDTHVCVCASRWQGQFALPLQSLVCSASQRSPGTGMAVQTLLLLITTRHIQPKAEVQSGCLWQRQSPCIRVALQASILSPALCSSHCQLNSGVLKKTFTRPKVPKLTSGNSDWGNGL